MILRSLVVLVGSSIIGAMAHVAIIAAGGYGAPTAPLQIAVALGLCTGSVCIGAGLRDRRWLLAFVLVVALLSGEAYAILTTSEVTIASRDAAAAPLRDVERARGGALARVEKAETAKTKADDAAISEAAKPGCRKECRILLEGAKADAKHELDAARAALEDLPPPRSTSPLAERLHVDASTLDLIAAALRSIAINGLGAALIAFGSHGRRGDKHRAEPRTIDAIAEPAPVTARDHAARFGLDMLAPGEATVPVTRLHAAYVDWCRANGQRPFAPREIGIALLELFQRAGVEIAQIGGEPHVRAALRSTAIGGARSLKQISVLA